MRTTFIRFGSREYSRSNHCGPSSRGAMAVISGFTLMAPLVSSSMARGYSPAEAHEPWRRTWRVTAFCSGKVTSGVILPTRVTVPPLRTEFTAARTVASMPTASTATSTPALFVRRRTWETKSSPVACRVSVAPTSLASFKREASTSATYAVEQPAARRACRVSSPIIPAPRTRA